MLLLHLYVVLEKVRDLYLSAKYTSSFNPYKYTYEYSTPSIRKCTFTRKSTTYLSKNTFVLALLPMKKCSNFLESLLRWDWYKCRKWSTTGAIASCLALKSFKIQCREIHLNHFPNFIICRTTKNSTQTKTDCSN